MPVTYDPNDATSAWPEGTYAATLEDVEDTTSKSKGTPMQIWSVRVYHPDGRDQLIKDYVTVPACTWKIGQFASAIGKSAEFKAKTFQADDVRGVNFDVELAVETSSQYPDKNKIGKYATSSRVQAASPVGAAKTSTGPHTPVTEEDIPF